ncbi:MAG: WecB/TagA/CpsF family glycosyltransferase [Oscillospiraceae bacterium]|nr:WecB/TagA/CpsF family glycosyltransferase [Oscillospiraceae bacterium]
MHEKVSIYGISYDNVTLTEAAAIASDMLIEEKNHVVVTPNAEIAYLASKDEELCRIINSADIVIADGIGVVYASKIYGTPVKEKVAGVELGELVMRNAEETGNGIFFLGAKPGVGELAAGKLSEKYPGLNFVGIRDGYFKDDAEVISAINESGADILYVCLGAPKQERWIAEHRDELNVRLTLGLGGALDSWAGVVKRAPEIWIRLGLEWLYRLIREPKRFVRMLSLPKYMFAVIFDSLRKR